MYLRSPALVLVLAILAILAILVPSCATGSDSERNFTPQTDGGGGSGEAGTAGSSAAGGSGGGGNAGYAGSGGSGGNLPDDFENPCNENTDCISGICVEGPDGAICSTPCEDSCPEDYDCLPYEGLSPPQDHVCIPRLAKLCQPCAADADCHRTGVIDDPSRCISWGDPGSFCGVPCQPLPCPDSYACESVSLPGGINADFCLPDNNQECECRPDWDGMQTLCSISNTHGSCPGVRSCGVSALTPCDASTPAAEVCDGLDNNCNGAVDEGTCDDGIPCTVDLCDGTTCSNPIEGSSCLIDGTCASLGQANPSNNCEVCTPSLSQTSWTVKTGPCDDGDPCTGNDTCVDGVCVGVPIQDDYEPNDELSQATVLSNVSDCDSFPKGIIEATLYGPGDEDWFRYYLSDDWFCFIYPRARLTVPPGVNYDLCVYVSCEDNSEPSVSCTSGVVSNAYGMKGCCSHNTGNTTDNVRINHNCAAIDDSAMVYVRVFNAGTTYTCEPYTLEYGDD